MRMVEANLNIGIINDILLIMIITMIIVWDDEMEEYTVVALGDSLIKR